MREGACPARETGVCEDPRSHKQEGTPQVNRTQWRPWLSVVSSSESLISSAGGVLVVQAARVCGLERALSAGLRPWKRARAIHDPAKILLDLAITVALGGDCAADIAVLRAQPGMFGSVASDPTVSRTIDYLADAGLDAADAIRAARGLARAWVWQHAGTPTQAGNIVLDLDATLLIAHSDKEHATKTWKKTFGHHPLLAFVDHGEGGTGEPVAGLLRRGSAGSNTAQDHVRVLDDALAQIPEHLRRPDDHGQVAVLVRTDAAGATHAFTDRIVELGMEFSVGASLGHVDIHTILAQTPRAAWTPAYNADGKPRDGAWVVEVTDLAELSAWPAGARLILRKERPHPGAQLRIADAEGMRITGFLTNTTGGQLADLELRHRRHARVEDRIRCGKDTGLRNLPFHDFAQNQVWLEICALAADLIAWTQRLALTGAHRIAEPKRLRLRLFSVAGRLVRTARHTILKIHEKWPWAEQITSAHARLVALTRS
jgi:hypothetical protein